MDTVLISFNLTYPSIVHQDDVGTYLQIGNDTTIIEEIFQKVVMNVTVGESIIM